MKSRNVGRGMKGALRFAALVFAVPFLLSCTQADVPGSRTLSIPSPTMADERADAINDRPDSVLYVPLGSDVLVPEVTASKGLPSEMVGPFELRGETLAGALQLILADYEIPLAFESEEGLTRTITVANLRGSLDSVVEKVCGLADLYCSYEDDLLVVKDTQTFTVTVPPVGGDTDFLSAIASGLQAITGASPVTETATRAIIYEATSRTAKLAERYFQRIRSNTALIVFEIYIWEVQLNSSNGTGIDWTGLGNIGGIDIDIPGSFPAANVAGSPISIGLPVWADGFTFQSSALLEFLSNFGAVKTISQPQITMLSGSEATLRAADTENYVSSFTRTIDGGEVAVSTEVDSVDTGFTMTIASNWDNATVYGNIDISVQQVNEIEEFVSGSGDSQVTLGLPLTTERELSTQIRIRPGDSLLIAGLVQESDNYDKSGPGFSEVLFPTSQSQVLSNTELVFLLKPRVIVYTEEERPQMSAKKAKEKKKKEKEAESYPQGSVSGEMINPSL